METLTFNFKGKEYKAYIQVNTSGPSHYYWCYFSDQKLKDDVGGCITFKTNAGKNLELVYGVSYFSSN